GAVRRGTSRTVQCSALNLMIGTICRVFFMPPDSCGTGVSTRWAMAESAVRCSPDKAHKGTPACGRLPRGMEQTEINSLSGIKSASHAKGCGNSSAPKQRLDYPDRGADSSPS